MAQLMLQTRQAAAHDRLVRSVRELRTALLRFSAESPAFATSLRGLLPPDA